MIRREFLKLLGGLPLIDMVTKTKEINHKPHPLSRGLVGYQFFNERPGSSSTWYRSGDGYIRIDNGTSHVVFEGQPIFYKDKLEG